MATSVKTNKKTETKKRKLKMPHTFTLLFGIILVVTMLTWIAPGGYYIDNTYVDAGRQSQGIVDAFMSIGKGFIDAASLVFFLFGIGAFINIVMKSQAMEAAIGTGLKKLQGKEIWMIPIFMLFFAFGGTIYGMAEESLAFYILLVPVFVLAGFDAITGVFVIMLGAGTGVLTSTVNPFAIGAATDAAGIVDSAGVPTVTVSSGMAVRWVAFFTFYVLAVSFTMWYAKRVKADKTKSALSAKEQEEHVKWAKANYDLEKLPKFDKRRIATLSLFISALLFMVFSLIPWKDFGITAFGDMSNWVSSNMWFISSNGAWEIGLWYFTELGVLFILLAVVVGYINRQNQFEIYGDMVAGASDMLGVALVISVSRGVSVILGGSDQDLTIVGNEFFAVDGKTVLAEYSSTSSQWEVAKNVDVDVTDWLNKEGVTEIVDTKHMFKTETGYSSSSAVSVNLNNTLLNSLKGIGNMPKAGFAVVNYIVYIPMSILVPSTSGLAGATFGIMGPLAETVEPGFAAVAVTGFSFASGIVNLVTPTSGIVMGALVISRVEYTKYLKTVSPYLGIMFVASILMMLLASIEGFGY